MDGWPIRHGMPEGANHHAVHVDETKLNLPDHREQIGGDLHRSHRPGGIRHDTHSVLRAACTRHARLPGIPCIEPQPVGRREQLRADAVERDDRRPLRRPATLDEHEMPAAVIAAAQPLRRSPVEIPGVIDQAGAEGEGFQIGGIAVRPATADQPRRSVLEEQDAPILQPRRIPRTVGIMPYRGVDEDPSAGRRQRGDAVVLE